MARTRNASSAFDVQLDRQGNPISPAAAHLQRTGRISGGTILEGPGVEPIVPQPAIVGYRASVRSWSRNMDAFELAMLFDLMMRKHGGFRIDLTPEEFSTLPGDVRRHFLAVREEPAHAAEAQA